jgi:hypothetical protein
MTTFTSDKRLLPDILQDIVKGKIQLPDFQRGGSGMMITSKVF